MIIKSFFKNADIDIFCNVELRPVLKNNPYVNNIFNSEWGDLHLQGYHVILEKISRGYSLYEFLTDSGKYNSNLSVFNLSNTSKDRKNVNNLFTPFIEFGKFNEFILNNSEKYKRSLAHEIFITQNELTFAKDRYDENGVKDNENIIILLDRTTSTKKLLNTITYINFVKKISSFDNARLLVFDERVSGKKNFYKEILGDRIAEKFIFAEGTNLRESICLLADKRVKMIFGPCTGLLYIASGIYNVFKQKKHVCLDTIPLMLAYTGKLNMNDIIAFHEYEWWNGTFVDCIKLIKNDNGHMEIKIISEEDKNFDEFMINLQECNKYSAESLYGFIQNKYHHKLKSLKLIS